MIRHGMRSLQHGGTNVQASISRGRVVRMFAYVSAGEFELITGHFGRLEYGEGLTPCRYRALEPLGLG